MPTDFPDDAPRPRLCHLIKWPDFEGYGFNLHAEKTRNSHLIGTVDKNSPAELAGLREGDFIIEVNDVNVSNENHKQVVERIKTIPSETKLLVLDAEAEKYYKSKKIVVKGTQSNVLHLKTPVPQPIKSDQPPSAADDDSLDGRRSSSSPRINGKSNGSLNYETLGRNSRSSSTSSDALNEDRISRKSSSLDTPPTSRNESKDNPSPTTLTPPHTPTSTDTVSSNGSGGGHGGPGHEVEAKLNLNMTASEMRAMLARQKKHDPRRETMDFRKKHAIIQDM